MYAKQFITIVHKKIAESLTLGYFAFKACITFHEYITYCAVQTLTLMVEMRGFEPLSKAI